MRHAKSSWKDPDREDFDRPLNHRGKENAPLMGRRLLGHGFRPQLILASPALRARQTAELVAAGMDCLGVEILFEPRLYKPGPTGLIEVIRELDNGCQDVLVIGHNPGLSSLARLLAARCVDDLVTAGVVGLALPVTSWREIRPASGRVLFEDCPKKSSPVS
jgi:phosphohistidine phosphatase